jgi:hypothetical protein
MLLGSVDVSRSVQETLDEVAAFIPALLGALAILVIGYFIAKILGSVVGRVLRRVGFDRAVHAGPGGEHVRQSGSSPSRVVGRLTFWVVFLGALSLAVSALGIEALTSFVGAIFEYLPNVLAAVVIFLVAGAVATFVSRLARTTMSGTALGNILATAAPILIMAIAGFMILNQLKIAPDIVVITYAAILGAIALGSALAFGLGGRDVARQMLEGAYEKGQENRHQFKRDMNRDITRADTRAGAEEGVTIRR